MKSQPTNLISLFDKVKLDDAALKLRMTRLTDLHHAFEEYNDELMEYNDELMVLDPSDEYQGELMNLYFGILAITA